MNASKNIKIVEVSPRDGLQNESKNVPTQNKIDFINQLSQTGLSVIEVTSFVSPQWIPNLADHQEVFSGITKQENIQYPVLIFNEKGLNNAVNLKVKAISLFATPSATFCVKNANCGLDENLKRLQKIIHRAKQYPLFVRVYISCVLGCPYEGNIAVTDVTQLANKLIEFGVDEISLGDTIGVGTPKNATALIKACATIMPLDKIGVHFHDTYGQALANIYACLQQGVTTIDSSVAGLGGCPYAKGATGNVATEDVLYMLKGLGLQTGVELKKLLKAGHFINKVLDRQSGSKVARAL